MKKFLFTLLFVSLTFFFSSCNMLPEVSLNQAESAIYGGTTIASSLISDPTYATETETVLPDGLTTTYTIAKYTISEDFRTLIEQDGKYTFPYTTVSGSIYETEKDDNSMIIGVELELTGGPVVTFNVTVTYNAVTDKITVSAFVNEYDMSAELYDFCSAMF